MSGKTKAVFAGTTVPGHFEWRETDMPAPGAGEALVKVAAISLNRGEVRRGTFQYETPGRIGWDFAGTVERAAADGSGPKAGQRVVGVLFNHAWAEHLAVPSASLAVLPDAVSFADAATLPVAGLTALHALTKGGSVLGRKVLVSGATGGVGSFAVQLAHLSGAHVTAAIRSAEDEGMVRALGADAAAVGPDLSAAKPQGPYDLIIESVGGPSLGAALNMIAPYGTCVTFGAETPEATFNSRNFFFQGSVTLYGLIVFQELIREPAGIGLARLAALVAQGRLKTSVEVEAPAADIAGVAAKLLAREYNGKAVLHL